MLPFLLANAFPFSMTHMLMLERKLAVASFSIEKPWAWWLVVASLYFELVSCTLFSNKHMAQDQGKLATASFPSSISMCAVARRKILMLQVKLAIASFPWSFVMCLFQNRAHGTSSRYKLATTNHHGQDFSIGILATASFFSSISMCYYPRRKCLCWKES